MTVAPLANTVVNTVNGICPFSAAQDGVLGQPNTNLVRSLWAYDLQKETLPEVVDSMVRVASFETRLAAKIFCDQFRSSALSSRFLIYPNIYAPQTQPGSTTVASTTAGLQNGESYIETAFIAIVAPLVGLLEPSDYMAVDGPGLPPPELVNIPCIAEAYNFQFQTYNPVTLEPTTGNDWAPGSTLGSPAPLNGSISFYSPPVAPWPYFPNIFLNDGADGTAPVPLALGRTPEQVAEYAAKNSDQLYLGYTFICDNAYEGLGEPALVELSLGHSTAPVNG